MSENKTITVANLHIFLYIGETKQSVYCCNLPQNHRSVDEVEKSDEQFNFAWQEKLKTVYKPVTLRHIEVGVFEVELEPLPEFNEQTFTERLSEVKFIVNYLLNTFMSIYYIPGAGYGEIPDTRKPEV